MTDNEKKQIEEMALAICKSRLVADDDDNCRKCRQHESCLYQDIAYGLYNAGYRKQSEGEWIKVYQNKIATVYECSCCKHLEFATSEYCICGAHMRGCKNE